MSFEDGNRFILTLACYFALFGFTLRFYMWRKGMTKVEYRVRKDISSLFASALDSDPRVSHTPLLHD